MPLTPAYGNPAAIELVGRGVHYAPFLRRGHPVIVAVTSNHDWVGLKTLTPELNADEEIAKLNSLLDRKDPPLRLI